MGSKSPERKKETKDNKENNKETNLDLSKLNPSTKSNDIDNELNKVKDNDNDKDKPNASPSKDANKIENENNLNKHENQNDPLKFNANCKRTELLKCVRSELQTPDPKNNPNPSKAHKRTYTNCTTIYERL